MNLNSLLVRFVVSLAVGCTGLHAEDAEPDQYRHYQERTAWAGFLPGSWVEIRRDAWQLPGEAADDKEMLTEVSEDGSAQGQRFTRTGGAWVRKDYQEVFPGCVMISERIHWTSASTTPAAIVDSKGLMMTPAGATWTVARLRQETRQVAGRSLNLTTYRWSMRNGDGSFNIDLSYADAVAVPTHTLRVGRYVAEILLTADVVADRIDIQPTEGPRQIQLGAISSWSGTDLCGSEQLPTTTWIEKKGSKDEELTDNMELHLNGQVPGHQVLNRTRRDDGTWRTEALLAYHGETSSHLAAPVTIPCSWMHRKIGDWVKIELQSGTAATESMTPATMFSVPVTVQSRRKVVYLGSCSDGYPVLATRYLSGPQAGFEAIRVDIPYRPLLEQHATETSRGHFNEKIPLFPSDGTEEFVVYAMLDEWNRPWNVRVVRRNGMVLPQRQIFSWFVNGSLPTDALAVMATVSGQTLTFLTTDLNAKRLIGGRSIEGVAAKETMKSPSRIWSRLVFHSDRIPGVVGYSEKAEVNEKEVTRSIETVVDYNEQQ